jgi:carbon starvation protein
VKAIRARELLPTTEVPPEPSQLLAPAGLFPTAEERVVLAGADGGSTRFGRDREREATRSGP